MSQFVENSPKFVIGPYLYAPITTSTTTLVRTGQGLFRGIVINTKGASSNTLKIYDGVDTSGTLIATVDTTTAVGGIYYDLSFNIGLCIVTATGTQADITVLYR